MSLEERLSALKAEWDTWASTADRSTEGWEAAFPRWEELISAAGRCMEDDRCAASRLSLIKECWLISEEGEELIDFCKERYPAVRSTVLKLAGSDDPRIRWQIYAVLAEGDEEAKRVLLKGLDDSNSYARRRAILSLANHDVEDLEGIVNQLLQDPDPYIRQSLVVLVQDREDQDIKHEVFKSLRADPIQHVRESVPPEAQAS